MTAEELLKQIPKYKRIKRNAEFEIKQHQAEADEAIRKLNESIEKRDNAIMELKERESALEAMPTETFRRMLKLHYDEEKTWEAILDDIHCSPTKLYNSRPLALEEFQKAWDDNRKMQ